MSLPRFERSIVIATVVFAAFAFGARAVATDDKADEFRAKFHERQKLDDSEGISKLIRSYPAEAERWIAELCTRARGLGESEKADFNELSKGWQRAFQSAFAKKYFAFFSALEGDARNAWSDASTRLAAAINRFSANANGSRDSAAWNDIGAEAEKIAKDFDKVGDGYRGGQAWKTAAIAFDDTFRKDSDAARAAEDYGHSVGDYESVDFSDADVQSMKLRRIALTPKVDVNKPQDKGESGKQGEPKKEGDAKGQGGGATLTVPMTFQAVDKLDQYQRPHFHVDEIYQLWRPIPFGKNGDVQKFRPEDKGSPNLKRVTTAQFEIDADLDGKYEKQVPISGKPTLVTTSWGSGDDKREWAFIVDIGIEKDFYEGLQINLAPVDNALNLYTAGAASMVGKLGDTQIRVIDDDLNGVYGNWPYGIPYIGLTGKLLQLEFDSIVVGDSKRARPVSEYIPVKDQWYKLEFEKFGTVLKATPVKMETGTVKLDFKGPIWPNWLVLKGENDYENTYIDIAADGKKGVAVPSGSWHLCYGELRKGTKQGAMKCIICPGDDLSKLTWKVETGKEVTAKLGEPFNFDFDFEAGATSIKVIGESITVVGSAGEHYERLWNCVAAPEAEWRKAGAKSGSKPERFEHIKDQKDLDKYKWPAIWKPLDLELQTKEKVDKPEVHVFEKKNKFFGMIDSPWKK